MFYDNVEELNQDLARCLNREVLALVEAGCKHIQIDEPLIARKPQDALKYGIDHLKLCFEVRHKAVNSLIKAHCAESRE